MQHIQEIMGSLSRAHRSHQDPSGIPWEISLGSWMMKPNKNGSDPNMAVLKQLFLRVFCFVELFVSLLTMLTLENKSGNAGKQNGPPSSTETLRDPLGHWDPPWSPRGPPWDTPARPLTTTATISQQIYSGRRLRLLHLSPFIAMHHPNDSPGPLCHVYYENRALFGSPVQLWRRPSLATEE